MGDVAPDPRVEYAVQAFIQVKNLMPLPYSQDLQKEILTEAGFFDDYDTLYTCEAVFTEYLIEEKKRIGRG